MVVVVMGLLRKAVERRPNNFALYVFNSRTVYATFYSHHKPNYNNVELYVIIYLRLFFIMS